MSESLSCNMISERYCGARLGCPYMFARCQLATSVNYPIVQRRSGRQDELSTSKGDSSSNRAMAIILHSPFGGQRGTGENKISPLHVAS